MNQNLEIMFEAAARAKREARDMMIDFIGQFVEEQGGRYEFVTPLEFPTMYGGDEVVITAIELFEGKLYLCSPFTPMGEVNPKEARYQFHQLCGNPDDRVAMKLLEEN